MTKSNLVICYGKDITVEIGDLRILDTVSFSIKGGSKIGLLGPNGSGKTTLMKLITGQITRTAGELKLEPSVYYLPQVDLRKNEDNSDIISYVASHYEEWWDVMEFGKQHLGLVLSSPSQPLKSLSGGEFTKLNLAIGGVLNPSLLVMDEPSNHLDLRSNAYLIDFILDFPHTILLVSHDEFLLDRTVEEIWQLSNHKLRSFRGSYSLFLDQIESEKQSLERSYTRAQKEVRKARRAQEAAAERAARSRRVGKEMKHDRSMSTIEKGYFANKASKSAGDSAEKTKEMVNKAKGELRDLREKTRSKQTLNVQIASQREGRRHLIGVRDAKISKNDGTALINDINFDIFSGDRVVITGANGVGKTSFARLLAGLRSDNQFSGEIYRAPDIDVRYLSQNYEAVDPRLSVFDNVAKATPGLTYQEVRKILGNFLFLDDRSLAKLGSELSGGEVARLALAILNTATVDLLIMDEPTNNLDLDSLHEYEDALQSFQGAMIVISHNIPFLASIGVDQSFVIAGHRLVKLITSPAAEDEFFEEVLSVSE